MMKKLVTIILVIFSFPVFAQWEEVKLDSVVSFQLPKGYERTKGETENNFVARTAFGTILVFKAADEAVVTPDIERDRHLSEYYKDYVNRVRSSTPDGKITNEKDTLLGELKVKDFTLEVDSGGGVQLRKFRILHANNATYTFEFLSQQLHDEYSLEDADKFFNSIKVNENLAREDQFTTSTESTGSNNYWMFIAIGVVLIGLILYFVLRKKS